VSTGVAHVLYDVYMGWSHKSLSEVMQRTSGIDELGKGECAVFLNKSWTACKILASGNVLLYYRSPYGAPITKEQLRALPAAFSGPRLGFKTNLENAVMKAFEQKFGKQQKRLKVMHA
jgi:hypothetical protein